MPRIVLPAAAIALGLAGGGFALASAEPQAAPEKPRACFYVRNVNGFREAGDRTVYLNVGASRVYRLDLRDRCPELRWALGIGLDSHNSWVCDPLDVTVVTRSPIGPMRCQVQAVTRLSQEEVKALPRKHRP